MPRVIFWPMNCAECSKLLSAANFRGGWGRREFVPGIARSQNVYVSLQNRQKMTCLEADVHVWMEAGKATWLVGCARAGKVAPI